MGAARACLGGRICSRGAIRSSGPSLKSINRDVAKNGFNSLGEPLRASYVQLLRLLLDHGALLESFICPVNALVVIDGPTPGLSANLTLPDCVRVARFYRELGFAPNQGLGEEAKIGPLRAMTLCLGTFVLGSSGTLFL